MTNNFDRAPSSVCELYKARWWIEVFFKQIKQNLQTADFLGNTENAVRRKIWLTYALPKFITFTAKWILEKMKFRLYEEKLKYRLESKLWDATGYYSCL